MPVTVKRLVTRGHSLKAWRVGGLSPTKQPKGSPAKRGLWAFPFDVYDVYYCAHAFKAHGKKRRTFYVDGPFYARLDPAGNVLGSGGQGGWYLWDDAEAFRKVATRTAFQDRAYYAKDGNAHSVDTEAVLEIFIPYTTKIK